MTSFRSDRPYGSFPGPGKAAPPPDAPAPAPQRRLRTRIWGHLSGPLAVAVLLFATWILVDAVKAGGIRALESAQARPTPAPTPNLAAAVYAQIQPSVVQVIANGTSPEASSGAGVIVDDMANILTSLHIVADATTITVRFYDGTQAPATITSTLPDKDIAVLHPLGAPAKLVPATLGDPSRLSIGDPAFVIGHPFGLTGSLSAGVVSGLGRSMTAAGLSKPLTGLIQFDAAVNPGNSGGPLVDQNGEVVGIVTGLVNPAGQRVFSGVGFAITIDQAAGALGQPPD